MVKKLPAMGETWVRSLGPMWCEARNAKTQNQFAKQGHLTGGTFALVISFIIYSKKYSRYLI